MNSPLAPIAISLAAIFFTIAAIQIIRAQRLVQRAWAHFPEAIKATVAALPLWAMAFATWSLPWSSSYRWEPEHTIAAVLFPPIVGVGAWRWYQRFVKHKS